MKHLLMFAIALLVSTAAHASGRDIVDAVEADELESTLVTKVITVRSLQCQRPNLVSSKQLPNSLQYKIKYDCAYASNPGQQAVMFVAGSIENSDVLITSFSFENVTK